MNKKEKKEFYRLIKEARKLDEEFMRFSPLSMRLELNLSFSPKHNEWVHITNNLFRTRLPNSKNEHDFGTKEIKLDYPTIITSIYKRFNKWKYKVESPTSLRLKEIIERYS